MSTQIYHSSFARYTIDREVIHLPSWPNDTRTCTNCGNLSYDHNEKPRLFKYSRSSDGYGARINYIDGQFCSVSCMRQYHDYTETP
jgi:hypothetical protein